MEVKSNVFIGVNKRTSIRKEKRDLINLFGGCVVCGYNHKATLQVHHEIPISKGGSNDIDNLTLLCPNCHALVHSMVSDSFLETMTPKKADRWLQINFSEVQRDKLFHYALILLGVGVKK